MSTLGEARKELWAVAKQRADDVPYLLGGWGTKKDSRGQLLDGPREKWMPDLKMVKATMRFLKQTGSLIDEDLRLVEIELCVECRDQERSDFMSLGVAPIKKRLALSKQLCLRFFGFTIFTLAQVSL